MDAPLCPICNTKHYAREKHKWPEDFAVAPKPVPPSAKKAVFDRVRYQREYMRRWRAKKRV